MTAGELKKLLEQVPDHYIIVYEDDRLGFCDDLEAITLFQAVKVKRSPEREGRYENLDGLTSFQTLEEAEKKMREEGEGVAFLGDFCSPPEEGEKILVVPGSEEEKRLIEGDEAYYQKRREQKVI